MYNISGGERSENEIFQDCIFLFPSPCHLKFCKLYTSAVDLMWVKILWRILDMDKEDYKLSFKPNKKECENKIKKNFKRGLLSVCFSSKCSSKWLGFQYFMFKGKKFRGFWINLVQNWLIILSRWSSHKSCQVLVIQHGPLTSSRNYHFIQLLTSLFQ